MGAHLDARRRLAGAQDHRDGTARLRIVDMDRQKAALVIMGVEQRKLLMAMRYVAGVVDVERDARRRRRVRRHPLVDDRIGQADHLPQPRRVFEPRQRARPVFPADPVAARKRAGAEGGETRHRAGSWHKERRAVARIEATRLGLDIRFIVTNLDHGAAEWLYETLYCARGQAENLIKLHKAQLASDPTSCRSPLANQVRLVLDI